MSQAGRTSLCIHSVDSYSGGQGALDAGLGIGMDQKWTALEGFWNVRGYAWRLLCFGFNIKSVYRRWGG